MAAWTGLYEDRFNSDGSSKVNGSSANGNSYGNNGYGTGTGSYSNYSTTSGSGGYSVPQINYTPASLDDLLSEASGLIGGQYDAQILAAKQGYESGQQSLEKAYKTARQTTQDSAVARGMGRSSYLTDATANVGLQEAAAQGNLSKNYGDTVSNLQSSKSAAISSYVQSLMRQQEETMLQLAQYQAQLQYQYDVLNQKYTTSGSSSSGRSGGSSGSSKNSGALSSYQQKLNAAIYDNQVKAAAAKQRNDNVKAGGTGYLSGNSGGFGYYPGKITKLTM